MAENYPNGLTKEDIKEGVKNYLLEQEQMEKDALKLMYNQRYTLPKTIYKHLKEKGTIDGEDLLYFPEKYCFTIDEFYRFFNISVDYLQTKHEGIIHKDIFFENRNYYLNYRGEIVKFFIMYGQGTANILSLAETNEVEGIDVGTYDGWVKYVEKQYKKLGE